MKIEDMTASDVDAYVGKYGGGSWAGLATQEKAKHLNAARRYIRMLGVRREYLDPLHDNVRDAVCEAAVRISLGTLVPQSNASLNNTAQVASESVGEVSVTYAVDKKKEVPDFHIPLLIAELLRGLLDGRRGLIEVMRA